MEGERGKRTAGMEYAATNVDSPWGLGRTELRERTRT
jgi:hypothetical protein